MKGLFTASGSRGTKSLYWKARDAWDKTNEGNFHFKWYQLFVCVVPVRPLLSSIVDRLILDWENSWHFVMPPLAWLPYEKTLKERPQTKYHYPDLMHLTGWSKFLTLPDQSNLSDVTSSVWSFCTPYTRVGSITSRCSQNEPTLLPWTDSGTHGFATVNYYQSNSYLLKSSRHHIFIFLQHILNEGCQFVVWCGARSRLRAF